MSAETPVDLIFLWHHHQPDYRSPRDGTAMLPWVRLHATKDYLDMARRLERHPGVRAAFNFVPSLLDQLEDAARGAGDELFDALGRDPAALGAEERDALARRAGSAPSWAFERWPAYAALARRVTGERGLGAALGDEERVALETYFLLAWLDPMFHGEPAAAAALAALPHPGRPHRDALLALHRRLVGEVIPAYRDLAARGQIELTTSPYDHPILPLLVDLRTALRARPSTSMPAEPFAAPEDAAAQIARALERHARAFGAKPAGMWPSEGSVSPEVLAIAAGQGVRWMASDEAVLWRSLGSGWRGREAVYRPWKLATPQGDVALLFRDHELSDRIGFVYQRWNPREAAEDLIARLRRIGREYPGDSPPLVSLILDGENCWEHYAEDGGPFLEALYGMIEHTPEVRTVTPSEALAAREPGALPALHSGSWIDADFHIWIGHPEKNRAWDHVSRARRALLDAGVTPDRAPRAWESIHAAEGSDWFWWFGEDHASDDRATFDRLFREHVIAAYERAGLTAPGPLRLPITGAARGAASTAPIGFVTPVIDGRETSFYEWHDAGRLDSAAGSAMHREGGRIRRLHYGFDPDTLSLRLDVEGEPIDALELEFLAPLALRLRVAGLTGAAPAVEPPAGSAADSWRGARAAAGRMIEIGLPREPLGLAPHAAVALIVHLLEDGRPVESVPADDALRFTLPGPDFADEMWSA